MSAPHKNQYTARLENQKAQLERHGNFAEVVIRTTPEGTDVINFARMWEHVLVVADRQTRGYIAKSSREDFDKTRDEFDKCMKQMVDSLQDCVKRHEIDLTGSNFVSRVAQRYGIADRKRTKKTESTETVAPVAAEAVATAPVVETKAAPAKAAPAKTAPAPVAPVADEVEGF